MWTIALVVIALVVVVVLLRIASQPPEFSISRAAEIHAQPEEVFALVNDFHRWEDWSPWAKLDPGAKNGFEGPGYGEGAAFWWSGNKSVGEGRMTITESRPPEVIRIRLEFMRPMKAVNTTEFTFTPEGGATIVLWTMTGTNTFVGRVMCLFMNMDKMVGAQFEKGLASMKAIAEGAPGQ